MFFGPSPTKKAIAKCSFRERDNTLAFDNNKIQSAPS